VKYLSCSTDDLAWAGRREKWVHHTTTLHVILPFISFIQRLLLLLFMLLRLLQIFVTEDLLKSIMILLKKGVFSSYNIFICFPFYVVFWIFEFLLLLQYHPHGYILTCIQKKDIGDHPACFSISYTLKYM
jgi:hypothetical protein